MNYACSTFDLIENLQPGEQSRDILVALMDSRESYIRGEAVEKLATFPNDLVNDEVIGCVINMARGDRDQFNCAWVFDFMSEHPNDHFDAFLLTTKPADIKPEAEGAYTHALYCMKDDTGTALLTECVGLAARPMLRVGALLSLSYLNNRMRPELPPFLWHRRWQVKLVAAARIAEAVGSQDTADTIRRLQGLVAQRLQRERYRMIREALERSATKLETLLAGRLSQTDPQ
ncbi:hypothetical protein [Niveispirillum sp. KHB5.9]|uniref:hypothetical protein n=1 Tax=Niveispirillum sp. KHB5.9 TaxID=3400269 RepID=UPI003A8AECEA